MLRTTKLAVATLALAVTVAAGGCAGIRTEHQGVSLGRAICDVKRADNADEAQRALEKVDRRLNDAIRIVGRPVREDVRDIENNLSDLAKHASSDQTTLARQDLSAISRNVDTVASAAPARAKRFYQGLAEGLAECT